MNASSPSWVARRVIRSSTTRVVVDGRGRVYVELRGYRTVGLPGRLTIEEAMAGTPSCVDPLAVRRVARRRPARVAADADAWLCAEERERWRRLQGREAPRGLARRPSQREGARRGRRRASLRRPRPPVDHPHRPPAIRRAHGRPVERAALGRRAGLTAALCVEQPLGRARPLRGRVGRRLRDAAAGGVPRRGPRVDRAPQRRRSSTTS